MQLKLNKILEETVPPLGFELVDIEVTPARTVRVFIDKEGGINIDDCEFVSQHLNRLFTVEDIDYNRLEVSSPGIERPLKKLQDYVRFKGKLAKIKTYETISDQKVFQGHILDTENDTIKLKLENGDDMVIDFANIMKARLVFEDNKNKKTHLKKKK